MHHHWALGTQTLFRDRFIKTRRKLRFKARGCKNWHVYTATGIKQWWWHLSWISLAEEATGGSCLETGPAHSSRLERWVHSAVVICLQSSMVFTEALVLQFTCYNQSHWDLWPWEWHSRFVGGRVLRSEVLGWISGLHPARVPSHDTAVPTIHYLPASLEISNNQHTYTTELEKMHDQPLNPSQLS